LTRGFCIDRQVPQSRINRDHDLNESDCIFAFDDDRFVEQGTADDLPDKKRHFAPRPIFTFVIAADPLISLQFAHVRNAGNPGRERSF
jgi:hypothetical protein